VSGRETVRSAVNRWEIDNTEHFTVAFYFVRLGDATFAVLDALGLSPAALQTTDAYVNFQRELRMGDVFHIESAVIDVTDDSLLLGHKIFDSGDGALTTTVEQRLRGTLTADARKRAEAERVTWDGPKREIRPQPRGLDKFYDTIRDSVRPWEIDLAGGMSLRDYIHRFAAANGHATAAFGLTPAYYREERGGFSTFEFQLTFDGLLEAGEMIVVKSAPLHIGNSSMRIFHQMLNARTGKRVATLDQFGVMLDLDGRRPKPLPDWMKERGKALVAPTA
jgi:acyl-CoA thioester hydrolase